jgi:hypothetical protein
MSLETKKSIANTSFDEALDNFREFLLSQGLSTNVIWMFCEDVIFQSDHIFVKTPVSIENELRAEDCYKLGQKRNFGIALQAFCLFESKICCYIYLPEDDIDAQYSLMSNEVLKYGVRANLKDAEPTSSLLKWKVMKLLNPKLHFSNFDNHMPSKVSLLPEFKGFAPTT